MTAQPVGVLPFRAAIEAAAYLRGRLAVRPEPYAAGVYVGDRVPATHRPRSVVFRRDGGRVEGLFDTPRLNVRVFADDEDVGEDLTDIVIALLLDRPNVDHRVTAVDHTSGPYGIPDATQHLRMALFDVTALATAL